MTEKYITRSSEIAARMLGGEMMIMSATDSTFFTLNEVATAIWQAADGRTPLSEIIKNVICSHFDVEPETARADAEEFILQLSEHRILLISDRPAAQAEAS